MEMVWDIALLGVMQEHPAHQGKICGQFEHR